jgi:hypothetical protein
MTPVEDVAKLVAKQLGSAAVPMSITAEPLNVV